MAAKVSKFKNYADPQTLEGKALAQMNAAMAEPYAIRGALMPDAHTGYALPIGAVVESYKAIVPAWVGYDIGCGVSCSVLANVKKEDFTTETLNKLKELILSVIPVGNNRHKKDWGFGYGCEYKNLSKEGKAIYDKRAALQLGTLGGGNHFIELGFDRDNRICITIHSGSRGFGHGLATHYMKVAAEANGVHAGNTEGNYPLIEGTLAATDYFNDALIAQEFALSNRKIMTDLVTHCLTEIFNKQIIMRQFVNRNHNHVEKSGESLYIHRKGATHAEKGMLGVIPGNMRDGCFIVEGKGNEDWLNSSSHGAGRVLSRSLAKQVISLEMMQKEMKGIVGCISESTIDESPSAYKNIFDVMDLQEDSVKVINYIKPILNIKG